MSKYSRIVVLILCAAISQTACYTNYFISKNELRKLESNVETKETVTVFGDCPEGTVTAEPEKKNAYRTLKSPLYAEADSDKSTATDADKEEAKDKNSDSPAPPPGCVAVDVSTNNPLKVVTKDGDDLRVTPFNFIMSGKQIVSPEYNLLENLDNVKGAEVSEFSTWKTVVLIVGVAAAAVGTFVGISMAAGKEKGFAGGN